jgi:hypothetical protein
MTIPLVIGVNPLQTTLFELGIVSGRVALLLRSAEIHPVFVRFVTCKRKLATPPNSCPPTAPGRVCCGHACAEVPKVTKCYAPASPTTGLMDLLALYRNSREGSAPLPSSESPKSNT